MEEPNNNSHLWWFTSYNTPPWTFSKGMIFKSSLAAGFELRIDSNRFQVFKCACMFLQPAFWSLIEAWK
jgi:hypothetical protein